MCRSLHVTHARGIGLVMWRLGRYAHASMGDHDDNATGGIFVYFNSPHPVELYGTHGGSGAALR
jgi:hypothetical protein